MKWDIKNVKNWGPERHEMGALIPEAGNARQYNTGGWATEQPVRDDVKCTQCLFCYFFCPDAAVIAQGQKVAAFDYEHCKGCGICAKECPADAIDMRPVSETRGHN